MVRSTNKVVSRLMENEPCDGEYQAIRRILPKVVRMLRVWCNKLNIRKLVYCCNLGRKKGEWTMLAREVIRR